MTTAPPHSDPSGPPSAATDHDALSPGTRFGEFEIVRVLGVGGFGIVYLARDHSLERDVALKEYMPASLAARGAGPQITIRSSSFAETYAIGLRSFVNEARLLARFDHASLVKVYRFWEDNATAYMVMPYLQGITLRDARRGMTHAPEERWIRSVLEPIMSALELLHREGVYHRDIAPDNILLPPDGPPVLLDFGAARRVISDRTQSLTAILKPSYAPIEQYAEMTQLRQGPWTDLYALGAVVHYLLFGVPPLPATARAVQDDGESIADRSVPGVSPRMLEAVAWALAIRPNQRPQSVDELRGALDGRVAIPALGRQRITLPGSLAPLAAATPASAGYEPTMRVESTFTEPTRLESRPMQPPQTLAPQQPVRASAAAGATSFPPTLGPPPQVRPPASTSGPPAAVHTAVPPLVPAPVRMATLPLRSLPPAPPPARQAVSRDSRPPAVAPADGAASGSTSKVGVIAAVLGVLMLAAGAAIWLFGLPRDAGIAAAPAASAAVPAASASTSAAVLRAVATPSNPTAPALPPAPATPLAATPSTAVPAVMASPAPAAERLPPATPVATPAKTPLAAKVPSAESQPVAAKAVTAAAPTAAATTAASTAASRPRAVARRPVDVPLPASVERVEETRPAYSGGADGRGRPYPARETAPPPRPVAAEEAAGPTSARQACGGRVFIALAVCMDRECEQPRFRNTAECIPILATKRARENR
jgi:serine/threonine protein kinase